MQIVILAILPALIAAQIQIDVVPPTEYTEPVITLSGTERVPATDRDMKTFHLTKNEIYSNLDRLGYKSIDNIYVNHASSYGHRDLYINLKPVNSRILRSNQQPVKFEKNEIQNANYEPTVFKIDVNHVLKETLQGKWYETQDLSVGRNIDIKFSFNRLSHTSSWGQQDYETKTTKIRPQPQVSVTLKPQQSAKAVIRATQTSMEFRIDYEVNLDGDLYFEYLCVKIFKLFCAHNKVLDINEYFHLLEYQGIVKAYQVVNVNFYSDAHVVVSDINSGEVLADRPIPLSPEF